MMLGRAWDAGSSHRYGFQGQEHDDEINGDGNILNFKYRVYDPRLGRFLSVDPLDRHFPWNSTYAFAENKVIQFIELEGAELAVPRILPRVYIPRPVITIPRMPVPPTHPIPPVLPLPPQAIPQAPNLPHAPALPRNWNAEGVNWDDVDMTNPETWPKPPVEGELTPGDPSRNKPKERGEKSLFDEKGGEWRPHKPDKYHPDGHWNYKPKGDNMPWEDVFIKILPPAIVYPVPPAENNEEYQDQMKQYKKDMKRYEKDMRKYNKAKERYYENCNCKS